MFTKYIISGLSRINLCLCIYLLSSQVSMAWEFRLNNPQECQNWGKTAAIVQLAKQKDIPEKAVVAEYKKEVRENPRTEEEVKSVLHLIHEVYSKFDIDVHFMQVYDVYFSSCIENQGLVHQSKDI